jgi:hypothetical protein
MPSVDLLQLAKGWTLASRSTPLLIEEELAQQPNFRINVATLNYWLPKEPDKNNSLFLPKLRESTSWIFVPFSMRRLNDVVVFTFDVRQNWTIRLQMEKSSSSWGQTW